MKNNNSLEGLVPVFVFGKLCMFTESRINYGDLYKLNDERKFGINIYSIRHADDSEEPSELCKNQIVVNRLGSLICMEPIENEVFNFDKYWIDMKEDDFVDDPEVVECFLDDMYCELFEYDDIADTIPHNITEYIDLVSKGDPSGWDIPLNRIHKNPEPDRRVFISQPFTGFDDKIIESQRHFLFELYCDMIGKYPTQVTLINQHTPYDYFDKDENFVDEGQHHFYQFCRSIGMMAKATDVIIYGDWEKSRGCNMEVEILKRYGCLHQTETVGVKVIHEKELHDYCLKKMNERGGGSRYGDLFMVLWKEEYFKMYPVRGIETATHLYDADEEGDNKDEDNKVRTDEVESETTEAESEV